MSCKVLYLSGGRNFFSDGAFRKSDAIVNCWRSLGFDVLHINGGDVLPETQPQLEYGSHKVHEKWYRRTKFLTPLVHSASEYRDKKHDKLLYSHLQEVFVDWRPDIVWERSSRLHASGLKIAEEYGIPSVLEWKDNLVTYNPSLFRKEALELEQEKNLRAGYVVVESHVLKAELVSGGVDKDKILVAHNAVDFRQFSPNADSRSRVRRELGVDDHSILVGYLGSYSFYHDTKRLILAANLLREKNVKNIKIFLVGAGKEFNEVKQLAEELNLPGDFVSLMPGVSAEKVPEFLSALDVAVLPGSTDIICPIKIQEYMSMELATIAPDYECNREVLKHGETGSLFEPMSEYSLADRILELAASEDMRLRLGKKAREEIQQKYTWEKTWGSALQQICRSSEMPN